MKLSRRARIALAQLLASQKGAGTATCAAKSGSKALAQSVSKQLLSQKK